VDKLRDVPGDWRVRLDEGVREVGVSVLPESREKLLKHVAMVREECQRINLVSARDRDFLIERHVVPSLAALEFIRDRRQDVLDIGSGAGFPGVEIALCKPALRMTLLEATRKKAVFLERVVQELEIDNAEVIWDRAENLLEQRFDTVLARGVAPMPKLQDLAAPLLEKGGKLITWKGSRFASEMAAVKRPRFRVEAVRPISPPRNLVILRRL
jgi:16S rRNA (guanine527-N7)-methyltransferase